MTLHHVENSDAISASADFFLADVKLEMKDYAPEEVLNTDQVGLKLELHSTRTLLGWECKCYFGPCEVKECRNTLLYYPSSDISCWKTRRCRFSFRLKEAKWKMSDTKLTNYMFFV